MSENFADVCPCGLPWDFCPHPRPHVCNGILVQAGHPDCERRTLQSEWDDGCAYDVAIWNYHHGLPANPLRQGSD